MKFANVKFVDLFSMERIFTFPREEKENAEIL
jgi:hypothetical protein